MADNSIYSTFIELAEKIYASTKGIRFEQKLFSILNDELLSNFNSGIGAITTSNLNAPDFLRQSLFESNIARFAASKTSREVLDLNRLKNKSKDVNDFVKQANALNIKYNEGWLKAEYQTAYSVGQNSRDYFNQIQNEDIFPFVQFDTIGDGLVRDEHRKLDGIIVKVGSKEHDLLTPPLGYNCRCKLRPLANDEVKASKVKQESEIIKTLKQSKVGNQTAYDVVQDYGFNINRAKTNQVFTEAQMYIRNFKETGLSYADYGLPKHGDVKNRLVNFQSPTQNTEQWFTSRIGGNMLTDENAIRLKDYRNRPILWAKKDYKFDHPQEALHTIATPDEVWLFKDGKKWKRNYLKFYNDRSVQVEVEFGINQDEQITKATLIAKPDSIRKGLLLN
jgi:SPP1 gp7 family putative phage head morphogenesis protein